VIFEELSGPEFLLLYVLLLGAAFVVIAGVRLWPWGPKPLATVDQIRLDPYEAAYLQHGPQRVVEAAVAAMVHAGAFKADGRTVRAATPLADDGIEFERAVHGAVSRSTASSARSLRADLGGTLRQLRNRMRGRGFVVGPVTELVLRALPVLLLLGLVAFGIMRIDLGVSRGRPVGYLTLLVVLTVFLAIVVALYLWGRAPIKTRRGADALAVLKRLNDALRTEAMVRPSEMSGRDLAWVVGLFGAGAVNDATIAKLLKPPVSASSGSGSAGCSWGFTSCGGGGGCGGGGCGGGGCGG